jgi:hypothetical protein
MNHSQLSLLSADTKANAKGNTLSPLSCAIAINIEPFERLKRIG